MSRSSVVGVLLFTALLLLVRKGTYDKRVLGNMNASGAWRCCRADVPG